MSNLIPPLLSNSPPPIIGPIDDDDDDEFSDFRAAEDESSSVSPTPPEGSPQILPDKDILDINRNSKDVQENDILHVEVTENEDDSFGEFSSSENSKFSNDYSSKEIEIHSNLSDSAINQTEIEIDNSDSSDKCADIEIEASLKNVFNSFIIESDKHVEDQNHLFISDDDYQDFVSNDVTLSDSCDLKCTIDGDNPSAALSNSDTSRSSQETSQVQALKVDDDFGDFGQVEPSSTNLEEEDDDFGDFATPSQTTLNSADDFGNFAANFPNEPEKPFTLVLDRDGAFENTLEIVKEIFPTVENLQDDYQLRNEVEGDFIFNEMKDITETHALKYHWSKSTSQDLFLKALNIDTRNILYGPGWNQSMPRFASNLGMTPLEPVKTDVVVVKPVAAAQSSSPTSEEIPSVEFDWTGSGLVNPLDAPKATPLVPTQAPPSILQPEVLQTIPPLEPKVLPLDNDDNFSDFDQPNLDHLSNWSANIIPLRETHISNDDISTPPPSIDDVDDFDDFQMVLPTATAVLEPIKPPALNNLPSEAITSTEEEFTDFFSSAPPAPSAVTIMQPTVLEPIKSAKPATIEWPDPGISDDEIKRFEAFSLSRQPDLPTQDTQKSSNNFEDDEWSDFISVQQHQPSPINKLKLPDRTASPDLPLSVLNLSNLKSPKKSIPVITPQGLVQTKLPSATLHSKNAAGYNNQQRSLDEDDWSDFVSSPIPSQPVVNSWNAADLKSKKMAAQSAIGAAVPSISALPDLEFVAPNRVRTNNHHHHRK